MGWPRFVSFGYDEARVSRLALEMARQGHLATVGMPTSSGVPNFPGAVWLYSVPHALSSDPLIGVWFTALANVLEWVCTPIRNWCGCPWASLGQETSSAGRLSRSGHQTG
jgi:hypothetical protein